MAKKTVVIMPRTREILAQMGEQIHLARLRRKLTLELRRDLSRYVFAKECAIRIDKQQKERL